MKLREALGHWLLGTSPQRSAQVRGAKSLRDVALTGLPGNWRSTSGDAPITNDAALNIAVVYACVRRLAVDIAKLPLHIRRLSDDGIWIRSQHRTWSALARRPNHFQTAMQFMFSWMASRLLAGNAYILPIRIAGAIRELIVLDPLRVTPLIDRQTGAIYYRLGDDPLARITESTVVIPADMLMHDRYMPIHHPLIGTPPLTRALTAAHARESIVSNAGNLYDNGGVPPGLMLYPEGTEETDLRKAADSFRNNARDGKIPFIENTLKFETLATKYVDSQADAIAKLSAVEVCTAFDVPPWIVGLESWPTGGTEIAITSYLSQSLLWQIEEIEQVLDQGLALPSDLYLCFDTSSMLRLDARTRSEVQKNQINAAVLTPNEARAQEDLPPIEGGDTAYMQQQYYSLAALARRDATQAAAGAPAPAPPPAAAATPDEPEDPPPQQAAQSQPYSGIWDREREYPALGRFVTHRGKLWARVWRSEKAGQDARGAPREEIGREPGTDAGAAYWQLATVADLLPVGDAP